MTKHLSTDRSFDVLILADLLFNHSEHEKLIKSVQLTLNKTPRSKAYVFFTPYRPWLLQKDLAFFDLAKDSGFTVTKTFEKVMDKVMFEEDPGVSRVYRSCVYKLILSGRAAKADGIRLRAELGGLRMKLEARLDYWQATSETTTPNKADTNTSAW